MLIDAPIVLWNDDGSPYVPLNYKGKWSGRVAPAAGVGKIDECAVFEDTRWNRF